MGGIGSSKATKSNIFWMFAGRLSSSKVIAQSQQEIYANFYRKFTRGDHVFELLKDPLAAVSVSASKPSVLNFRDPDLNRTPKRRYGLKDLEFSDDPQLSLAWNPYFKRPQGQFRLPVSPPEVIPDNDIADKDLRGLGFDLQEKSPHSECIVPAFDSISSLEAPADEESYEAEAEPDSDGHVNKKRRVYKALEGVFRCEITPEKCKTDYKTSTARAQHYRRKHADRTLPGEHEDDCIVDVGYYKQDKARYEKLWEDLTCTIVEDCATAGEEFPNRERLKSHYKKEHPDAWAQLQEEGVIRPNKPRVAAPGLYVCKFYGCPRSFDGRKMLVQHYTEDHPDDDWTDSEIPSGLYVCATKGCMKTCDSSLSLKQHHSHKSHQGQK